MKPKPGKWHRPRKSGSLLPGQRRRPVRWPLGQLNTGALTDRGYEEYEASFRDVLKKGKKVLDLGTGLSNFVEEARRRGVDAFGIDVRFGMRGKHRAVPKKPVGKYSAAAISQELPFPDKCFDAVISLYGTLWRVHETATREAIIEALRVLKVGGKLKSVPAKMAHDAWLCDYGGTREFFGAIRKAGFGLEISEGVLSITKTKSGSPEKLRKMWKTLIGY